MSLAVPWVIVAAAERWPDTLVDVGGVQMDCARLDRDTRGLAQALCSTPYSGSMPIPAPQSSADAVCRALAALRVGVLLSDRSGRGAERPPADADVLESSVWSETPAATVDGETYDHAAMIAAAFGDRVLPAALDPVTTVLAAIVAIR